MKKIFISFIFSFLLISNSFCFTRAEILQQLKDTNHQQLEQITQAIKEKDAIASSLSAANFVKTQLQADKLTLEADIKNLNNWAANEQKLKNEALAEVDKQKGLVAAEKIKVDKEHEKAVMAGKERDIFVFLFAILGAYLAISVLSPFIRVIPDPIWKFAAFAAAPVASFVACLVGLRWLIHFLVNIF